MTEPYRAPDDYFALDDFVLAQLVAERTGATGPLAAYDASWTLRKMLDLGYIVRVVAFPESPLREQDEGEWRVAFISSAHNEFTAHDGNALSASLARAARIAALRTLDKREQSRRAPA